MSKSSGKKYKEAISKLEKEKNYSVEEAIALIKEMAFAKFDETVELSIRLSVKKSESIRDTLVLPHQFGAEKKILVFAKDEKAEEAREAGAAYVGDADLVEKIKGGWLDFDIAVATPDLMRDVGKLGPILGRRGLMPNPKTRTVTFDIKEAIAELRKGRVEFRADKTGVVHCSVGKVSMESGQMQENINLLLGEIAKKKPSDTKGDFFRSVTLSSTMGPGVRVTSQESV